MQIIIRQLDGFERRVIHLAFMLDEIMFHMTSPALPL